MNKVRSARIEKVINKISELNSELNDILNEEQDCFDNMPENLQGSERGEEMERCIELLESSVDSLEECADALVEI